MWVIDGWIDGSNVGSIHKTLWVCLIPTPHNYPSFLEAFQNHLFLHSIRSAVLRNWFSFIFNQNPPSVNPVSFILLLTLKEFSEMPLGDNAFTDAKGLTFRKNVLGVMPGW